MVPQWSHWHCLLFTKINPTVPSYAYGLILTKYSFVFHNLPYFDSLLTCEILHEFQKFRFAVYMDALVEYLDGFKGKHIDINGHFLFDFLRIVFVGDDQFSPSSFIT